MKQTWIFYTVDNEGRKCIFNERECIKPELTKDWKELQQHLNRVFIKSVGYVLAEDTKNDNYQTKDAIQLEDNIKSCKSMMDSLYAYDGLSKDNSYLSQYIKRLGEAKFNEIYDEYSNYLTKTFTVTRGVHTDHEGCTYNSLTKI